MQPPSDISEMDRQIFELINRVRSNPALFVPHLQEMQGKFEGYLMKQAGKTTLRTKEGAAAVKEAIEFLNKQAPTRELKWHNELYIASRQHVNDIGPKGLV
jgi:uncharacterized protein YkwD